MVQLCFISFYRHHNHIKENMDCMLCVYDCYTACFIDNKFYSNSSIYVTITLRDGIVFSMFYRLII